MKRANAFALGAALAVLTACGPVTAQVITNSSEATTACETAQAEASRYGRVDALGRAEATTAGAVVRWQEERHGPGGPQVQSPFRSKPADAQLFVCIYYGQFSTPTGPPSVEIGPDGKVVGTGPVKPPHDTLRLIVEPGGEIVLDAGGYRDRMAPDTPGDFSEGQP